MCRIYIFDVNNQKARELGQRPVHSAAADSHNEITGLLRRRAFTRMAERILRESTEKLCVISVDIENFKLFNEWYGHDKGDLLMVQIGAKLREACEASGGIAGYFGQDDFCLLMPYDSARIQQLYDDISELILSYGSATGFMPAFGVCITDDGIMIRDALDKAFIAVRYAKESYHSRIKLFDEGMYSRTQEEYHVLSDFFQAMKRNEVVFYLQPQCRASTGRIVGAEALARWIKPDGTVVPPNVFIPVLEKHGLITDLDLFIWEEVCKWQRRWIDSGNTPLPVSVNVSAIDIINTDLTKVFSDLITRYRLPQQLLKIEITESAYTSNASLVKDAVQSLRAQGFTVLMDDFGSGYSSLNMLKSISVDVIKLDAQFLHMDESNEEKSIQILESITTMTQMIGIPVIVEGVESESQTKFLQDIGCRYIQGYYFYRPMPTESYEQLISQSDKIDTSGISFKANRQFRLRELLDNSVYSDNMLNNILGPCAFYTWYGENVDIVRFNEQFYEAVGVPDFHDRLVKIQRFMPPADHTRLLKLLNMAEKDRLNGASDVLHFYKTDGTLTDFFMRFFYLRTENGKKLFYGAVQDITKLKTLERQMRLLSRISSDTVIFMRRKPDDNLEFSVLFNGLERLTGMSREALEYNLNSGRFFTPESADNTTETNRRILHCIWESKSFTADVELKTKRGEPLSVTLYADYVRDRTGTLDYILTLRDPGNNVVFED